MINYSERETNDDSRHSFFPLEWNQEPIEYSSSFLKNNLADVKMEKNYFLIMKLSSMSKIQLKINFLMLNFEIFANWSLLFGIIYWKFILQNQQQRSIIFTCGYK